MKNTNIVYKEKALHIKKDNQTEVDYYLFSEYEIHYNKIPPHSKQEWHYHQKIEETILVVKGQMKCLWYEDQQVHTVTLNEKDLIQVKNSIHTFSNNSDDNCEFVVFRFVPDGIDKSEIIKNDKVLIE